MRIYLIDPKMKWYKANFHCHTNNSDGFYSPIEIKKIYQKHGYQIVAFSDHELIFDSSYLTDDKFVAITSSEYSITDEMNPANETYREPGQKLDFRDMKTIHLNVYAKDPHNTIHYGASKEDFAEYHINKYKPNEIKTDGYKKNFTPKGIQETIDRLNKGGFLVQFNHPNWSLNVRDDYINLKGLWGFEILNYGTEQETSAEYCINAFDDMIRTGHKVMCTMGDDNHNREGSLDDSFGGFNYIGVNNLTYEEVIKAMEKGNLYASNGPKFKSVYIDKDDGKIYVECDKSTDIILTGYNRIFRHYHGKNLKKADFKIFGNEVYFRISIKDKYGKVAHTQVYYLKDYGY